MNLLLIILSVFTTYQHSTYHSECEESVNASRKAVYQVVDDFIYDMQTDINRLGTWAFLGTEDKGDAEKDAIAIVYKDTYYDPALHYGYIIVDVKVPGLRTFKNIKISSLLTDTVTDGVRHARVDIDYSGSLLKMANATFHVKPLDENLHVLTLDLNVRFGWFFNIFVSRKVYRDVLEWRLQQIVNNLCEKAETGIVTGHYKELQP
ncbi:MAG: hypothetical protein IJ169_03425 [Paludibacteraceae bacterium]|nr:hypothetical protein [Paludibacteraceae bacterium]